MIIDMSNSNNMNNWIVFGDFNIVKLIDNNIVYLFNDTITNCNLDDIGFVANIFT